MKHVNRMLKKLEDIFSKRTKYCYSLDEGKSLMAMVTSKGYPFEEFKLETEDGYLLTIFRIPGAKFEEDYKTKQKQPVLFQHGLFDSSDCWVCNEEHRCLPYILANAGYDVWLGNSRGNKYCKEHKKYPTSSYEFWQFSLHEMGHCDLPTVLKFIKESNTSQERIIYFGHSQGTAMLFAAASTSLEFFKEYIKLFVALAPVAKISNMSSTLLKFVRGTKVDTLMKVSEVNEIFPANEEAGEFNAFINKHFPKITNYGLGLISDMNSEEFNSKEQMGVYMTHMPSGTSFKCLNHFNQIYINKAFTRYDYKKAANMALYKQITPPEYDLSAIKNFPIMLIGGKEDRLAAPDDVQWLSEQLCGNVIYFVSESKMGHASFMIGKSIQWFKDPFEIILTKYTMNEHKYEGVDMYTSEIETSPEPNITNLDLKEEKNSSNKYLINN